MTDIIIGPGDSPTAMVVNSDGSINVNTAGGGAGATAANQTIVQGTNAGTTGNQVFVIDPGTGLPITYTSPTQVLQSLPANKGDNVVTLTTTTAETTLLAAVASTFLDLYSVIASNSSATATELTFRDTTGGSARFYVYVPAGETRGFMLTESAAWKQATINTNWTVQSSASITSVKVAAQYVKNTSH